MTPKRRNYSSLWDHFEELVPGKKAKCGYCCRVLAISVSSIGSLRRHMRSIHPTIQIDSSTQQTPKRVPPKNVDSEKVVKPVPSCNENLIQVEDETCNDSVTTENAETLSHTGDVFATITVDEPPRKRLKAKQRTNFLKVEIEDDYYEQNDNLLEKELEAIGANVTCKLKRMNSLQRYHAELLINKVLITGLKNRLSDETDLTEVYTP